MLKHFPFNDYLFEMKKGNGCSCSNKNDGLKCSSVKMFEVVRQQANCSSSIITSCSFEHSSFFVTDHQTYQINQFQVSLRNCKREIYSSFPHLRIIEFLFFQLLRIAYHRVDDTMAILRRCKEHRTRAKVQNEF